MVLQMILFAVSFWPWKITTDPHIIVHVTTEFSDDSYPKFKIYVLELILNWNTCQ